MNNKLGAVRYPAQLIVAFTSFSSEKTAGRLSEKVNREATRGFNGFWCAMKVIVCITICRHREREHRIIYTCVWQQLVCNIQLVLVKRPHPSGHIVAGTMHGLTC
jgi:hypothetical protein